MRLILLDWIFRYPCAVSAAAVVGAAVLQFPVAQAAQVLSVRGVDLGTEEYVEGFEITTWNVKVLAVCRIPPGWSIKVANYVGNGGSLEGGASGTVAGLDRSSLNELNKMFLIADFNPNAGPIKLDGTVSIRTYGTGTLRDVSLQSSNYLLEPVERCP